MNVIVNGEPTELAPGATVEAVLARPRGARPRGRGRGRRRGRPARRVAASIELSEGARVEVLRAIQGG